MGLVLAQAMEIKPGLNRHPARHDFPAPAPVKGLENGSGCAGVLVCCPVVALTSPVPLPPLPALPVRRRPPGWPGPVSHGPVFRHGGTEFRLKGLLFQATLPP